jgi:hypothetical protein
MALATFTGPLTDFGLGAISTTGLEVLFVPNDTGATATGRMLLKDPIAATISVGTYTVQLHTTDDIFPVGAHYTLRVKRLGAMLFDRPSWKLYAPAGGGSILDMLAPPTTDRTFSELDARYVRRGELAAAVAAAMANDPTIAAAAAAAVDAELAAKDIVEGDDLRIWQTLNVPGLFAGIRSADGYMSEASWRSSDGKFSQFVIDSIAERIGAGIGTAASAGLYGDAPYVPGSDLRPIHTDMSQIIVWGSSSASRITSYLQTMAIQLGATYTNGGQGGEQAQQIAARLGSVPALLIPTSGTIPASGSVTVTSPNMPALSTMKTFSGVWAGRAGTLSVNGSALTFALSGSGPVTSVSEPLPLIPDLGEQMRASVTGLWMGKNNFSDTISGREKLVIDYTDRSFAYLAPLIKRVLVLGHFADTGTAADGMQHVQIVATNTAHAKRYGRLFVDIYGYFKSNQVWIDTGISPTTADREQQALGNLPPSLNNSGDPMHMNAAGYTAVQALIKARMLELDWY